MHPTAHGHRRVWRTGTPAAVALRRTLVGALLLTALVVRMREPLSSPIIGAEDPYLHMVHAWNLLQGHGLPATYPPGFAILLVPFALLGDEMFYLVARFLPPFLGVVQVLGVYLLLREHVRTPAALVGALVVALMPENVFRTGLLFPTALDLALLPFYFLLLLRASHGSRRALAGTIALAALFLVVHPWVVALIAPPTLVVAVAALRSERNRLLALGVLAAGAAAVLVFMFLPGTWNPAPAFLQNAGPRLAQLARDPSSLFPLPVHVNPVGMLTLPALLLAGVGALAALARPSRLGWMALTWTLFIIPFVFVDWFDIWFIPHRSVAYLSLGVAMLAALPVELMGAIPGWELADHAAAAVVIAMLLLLVLPLAWSVEPWYRLYDEDDYEAWEALEARDVPFVVTGSWQSATGYRAITGEPGVFNPSFFESEEVRRDNLQTHPGLVVLLDNYAREEGQPTGWLDGWREVGRWGDNVAYAPPG